MRHTYFREISLSFLLLLLLQLKVQATHNRAGEIRVEQIGDCNIVTVRATITTYTKASSINADRDTLTLCWGDGTCEKVPRNNGPNNKGVLLGNDIKRNTYVATHTYPGRATYTLYMTDPNRNDGIWNVNYPNSVNVKFHLFTTYTFLNPQFQGCNSTPELLQPPIDVGCVGQPFQHNPNAFDTDGDSLSYHFTVPLQDVNTPVPRYDFPNQIDPGPENMLTINEETGDILWDAPQRAGEFNLAMIIVEWRNGIPIDTTLRDMQITIEDCENLPPVVETPFEEICVVAGEVVEFDVRATAPIQETDQLLQFQAFGGPLELDISPATFELNDRNFRQQPQTKRFRWQTACEHISDQPYSVVFKAVDNFFDTIGLATLKTVRIKVVGPPPEDVQAESGSGQVLVTWEKPYFCEDAANGYFRGFSIWRREGSNQFPLDTCDPGLDGRGYTRLAFDQLEMTPDGERYQFLDLDVERGRTYCYRILGEFARSSPNGNYAYNRVQSLPSEEICVQLSRDIPLLTNADVLTTSTTDGQIEVRWSKPKAEDLDTLQNPGPYRYELFRATGVNGTDFQSLGSVTSPTFAEANDTIFTDTGLNTVENGYNYELAFYVNGESEPLGTTRPASSVFLTTTPTDNQNVLTWEEVVPWDNFQYVVYRLNDQSGNFEVLDTTVEATYTDGNLINGEEYCYKIESIGSYGIDGVIEPISNFSQEACSIPMDDVAPCPPVLTVNNICDEAVATTPISEFENRLHWTNPELICEDTDDVAGYNIYYAPTEGADFTQIASIDSAEDTMYIDVPNLGIAGCYVVTAVDSFLNESELSNIICVDNCPIYDLPNAFTPNKDGQNDVFRPYTYRFVERIDMQIFNRWGQLVYETTNPDIEWNGTNLNGSDLAEGVYFYTCQVFEQRVTGIEQRPDLLKGYIHLIRGEK